MFLYCLEIRAMPENGCQFTKNFRQPLNFCHCKFYDLFLKVYGDMYEGRCYVGNSFYFCGCLTAAL